MITPNRTAPHKPSQALTLAHDYWAKGTGLLLIALMCPLAWISLWIAIMHSTQTGLATLNYYKYTMHYMTLLIEILLIAVIGAIQVDDTKRGAAFPQRLFLLPMTTSRLVFWQMTFGIAAMAIIHLASTLLSNLSFGDIPSPIEPILFLATAYTWAMAIVWSFPKLSVFRVALLIALAVPFMWWLGEHYSPNVLNSGGYYSEGYTLFGFRNWSLLHIGSWQFLPITLAGYAAAVCGVGMARRGEGKLYALQTKLLAWLETMIPWRKNAFTSAQSAQFWFEFRQKGWAMPGVAIAMLLVIVPIMLYNKADLQVYMAIPYMMFSLLPLACLGFGLLLGQCAKGGIRGDLAGRIDIFRATRPVKDSELSAAILKSAFASLAMTWLVIALTCGAIIIAGLLTGKVSDWINEFCGTDKEILLLIPFLCYIQWLLLSATTLILMTGKPKTLISTIFTYLMILIPTGFGASLNLWSDRYITWEIIATCIMIALGSLFGIYFAHLRNLIKLGTARFGIGLWALIPIGIVFYNMHRLWDIPFPENLVLSGLCFGVASIGLGPLAIAWNRHR